MQPVGDITTAAETRRFTGESTRAQNSGTLDTYTVCAQPVVAAAAAASVAAAADDDAAFSAPCSVVSSLTDRAEPGRRPDQYYLGQYIFGQ